LWIIIFHLVDVSKACVLSLGAKASECIVSCSPAITIIATTASAQQLA